MLGVSAMASQTRTKKLEINIIIVQSRLPKPTAAGRQQLESGTTLSRPSFIGAGVLHHSQSSHAVLSTLNDIKDMTDEQVARNQAFRRNIASIAKLKSPERKILYNEWFTIIKRMERDPKFDLEALVRTRGRFTEHDHISYRDRLYKHQQQQQNNNNKLRCARSEPNFTSMMYLTSASGDTIKKETQHI